MLERVDTFKLTATLKEEKKPIHLLMKDGKISVNYLLYDSVEKALESFLDFMKVVYDEKCSDSIKFNEEPYIYEVIDENKSISAYREVVENKTWANEAIFHLKSFKKKFGKISLNDIMAFLKEYAESECSKDFTAITLIPSAVSNLRMMQIVDYGFSFSKEEIKSLSVEEFKEKFLKNDLIGYLCL